ARARSTSPPRAAARSARRARPAAAAKRPWSAGSLDPASRLSFRMEPRVLGPGVFFLKGYALSFTPLTTADFRTARERMGAHVHRTPLLTSRILNDKTGFDVRLKAELFQRTGSYKIRGPLNKFPQ